MLKGASSEGQMEASYIAVLLLKNINQKIINFIPMELTGLIKKYVSELAKRNGKTEAEIIEIAVFELYNNSHTAEAWFVPEVPMEEWFTPLPEDAETIDKKENKIRSPPTRLFLKQFLTLKINTK